MRMNDRLFRSITIANSLVLLGLLLGIGYFATRNRAYLESKLRSFLERDAASSRLRAEFGGGEPGDSQIAYPTYEIRIKGEHLRSIHTDIEQMLSVGTMNDEHKHWYPATFKAEGIEYDVKVRLKGDMRNHWEGPKKSWRIRFEKAHLFQGRRTLDLNIVSDKRYELEQVSYDIARELDVLVPDAGFCRLAFNGQDHGAYHWIEKYGPEMLEKQGLPVGEIFALQNVWVQNRNSGFGIWSDWNGVSRYYYEPAAFRTTIAEGADAAYASERFAHFLTLITDADEETFRREISHVLDVERWLRWNAITWMFGSVHAHWGDNLRWYYDNTAGQFQPILYDVSRYRVRATAPDAPEIPEWRFESVDHDQVARRLMRFPEYRHARDRILLDLVTDVRWDAARRAATYFDQLRPEFIVGVGAQDADQIDDGHAVTEEILNANRADLRAMMGFARLFVSPAVTGVERESARRQRLSLRLLPEARSPLEIERIRLRLGSPGAQRAAVATMRASLRGAGDDVAVDLPIRVESVDGVDVVIHFEPTPAGTASARVWSDVDDRLRLISRLWELELSCAGVDGVEGGQWVEDVSAAVRNELTGEALPDEFVHVSSIASVSARAAQPGRTQVTRGVDEFVTECELPLVREADALVLPAGDYEVVRTLTFPAGQPLRIEPGVTLRMGPGVSVLVYAPLTAVGTEDRPVRVLPMVPGVPWGVFAVVRAGATSRVSYLEVAGGGEAHANGLFLSGQLSFFHSDVELDHCLIRDATGDDGLNVKRGIVDVRQCVFTGNAADGFDADWIRGTIQHCVFAANLGDGLDFSGSRVEVRDCLFVNMPDKGISAGERTELACVNCVMTHCDIGVAIKDLSSVTLHASVLRANSTGVALYRKKQLFGGGRGRAIASLFIENGTPVSLDPESRFEVFDSGADAWAEMPRLTTTRLAIGDPKAAYDVDELGVVTPQNFERGQEPFRIADAPAETDLKWVEFPAVAGRSAGLVRPLDLDAWVLRNFDVGDLDRHR